VPPAAACGVAVGLGGPAIRDVGTEPVFRVAILRRHRRRPGGGVWGAVTGHRCHKNRPDKQRRSDGRHTPRAGAPAPGSAV